MPFVLIVGFLIAGICGYMAGLIGASNSPISGVGILSIVICASLVIHFRLGPWLGGVLFIGAIVLLYGWMLKKSNARA